MALARILKNTFGHDVDESHVLSVYHQHIPALSMTDQSNGMQVQTKGYTHLNMNPSGALAKVPLLITARTATGPAGVNPLAGLNKNARVCIQDSLTNVFEGTNFQLADGTTIVDAPKNIHINNALKPWIEESDTWIQNQGSKYGIFKDTNASRDDKPNKYLNLTYGGLDCALLGDAAATTQATLVNLAGVAITSSGTILLNSGSRDAPKLVHTATAGGATTLVDLYSDMSLVTLSGVFVVNKGLTTKVAVAGALSLVSDVVSGPAVFCNRATGAPVTAAFTVTATGSVVSGSLGAIQIVPYSDSLFANDNYNDGFKKRVDYFQEQIRSLEATTASTASTATMDLFVPLSELHEGYDKMDVIVSGLDGTFTFNPNFNWSGGDTQTVQTPISGRCLPLTVGAGERFFDVQFDTSRQPELWMPIINLDAQYTLLLREKAQKGYDFEAEFRSNKVYFAPANNGLGVVAGGTVSNYSIVQGISNPLSLTVVGYPTNTRNESEQANAFTASTTTTNINNWSCPNCPITNVNVMVGPERLFKSLQLQEDCYQQFRKFQLGSDEDDVSTPACTRSDWYNNKRIHKFALTSVIQKNTGNNISIDFAVPAQATNPSTGAWDILYIVELYNKLFVKVQGGVCQMKVTQNMPLSA